MKNEFDQGYLWDMGVNTIKELETAEAILASGKEELYGCIFGRDSLITCLALLDVYDETQDEYYLKLVKKVLLTLGSLQGKVVNIESGEEPGKMIHEYRPDNHEHLTKNLSNPWYVYDDNTMKSYDTVDATPLFLITLYEYYKVSNDKDILLRMKNNIDSALEWILTYGDSNQDGLIDYQFNPDRKCGGLMTQSWMDSVESVFHEDDTETTYPIAPVEAQSYAFVALKGWSSFFKESNPEKSRLLDTRAEKLKEVFNKKFVSLDENGINIAYAVDGNDRPLLSPRSSMGHCLWASYDDGDGKKVSILDEKYIVHLVTRLMAPDLFVPNAGIRTLSSNSKKFLSNSYHNGSIWPHDTAIIIKGLENHGFIDEAESVRKALLSAYNHFKTPIELFVYDTEIKEYLSESGQRACKKQAWSAAGLLYTLKAKK